MLQEFITLNESEVLELKRIQEPLFFKNDFDLIYESQIPNVGIVFIDGELRLIKKKKIQTLPVGSLIGLSHLINNTPLQASIKVLRNSNVILIEKSQILESISKKSGLLYQIISTM